MNNELTDRDYWATYWANYQYEKVPSNTIYDYLMPSLKGKSSFIEIGGFPGINAAYFYKNGFPDVTLLDFYIDRSIVSTFEQLNNLPENKIHCIESDFFKFESDRTYDVVFSLGFIEHFEDTQAVIERHVKLLSDNGRLLIILPNFRGINGCIQWLFDRKNLRLHNLESMKIDKLKAIMAQFPLSKWTIDYSRKPMVWLEPKPGIRYKLWRPVIRLFSHFLKLFPIKCRLLSPYIMIYAER